MANAKDLETESKSFVNAKNLAPGALVVWKNMGTPYTAEMVKLYGKY